MTWQPAPSIRLASPSSSWRRPVYTNTRVHEYTSTRVHEYTSTRVHEYTSTRVHEYTSTRVHEYTNTRIHEYTNTRIHEYTNTCLAYPVVLVDRWGATDDLATSSLHSSRLSVFLMAAPSVMPVHSGMLSSHLFFCQPLLRPPCIVPCRIVLASPEDLVMCPYHFSLRCFTVVKRSSWGPMACQFCFAPLRLRCGLCR